MTVIRIDTTEVSNVSKDFSNKGTEVGTLIANAKRAMDNLRASFTGNRAKAAFGKWDSMQNALQQAEQNLHDAAQTLSEAVQAFSSADGS